MDILDIILKVALTLCAIFLVILVLLQQGKGADAGAAFGGGASQSVFGSSGSGNFLTKSTWWLGFIFFACALALAYKAQDRQVEYELQVGAEDLPIEAVQSTLSESDVPVGSSPTENGETDVPALIESDVSFEVDRSNPSESDVPAQSLLIENVETNVPDSIELDPPALSGGDEGEAIIEPPVAESTEVNVDEAEDSASKEVTP